MWQRLGSTFRAGKRTGSVGFQLGEYRIKTNSKEEVPNQRELDGAMAFIYTNEKYSDNPEKNAIEVFKRLKKLETGTRKSNISTLVFIKRMRRLHGECDQSSEK